MRQFLDKKMRYVVSKIDLYLILDPEGLLFHSRTSEWETANSLTWELEAERAGISFVSCLVTEISYVHFYIARG